MSNTRPRLPRDRRRRQRGRDPAPTRPRLLNQAVIVCDEHGETVFRNTRAAALMGNRHSDAIAVQAVDELCARQFPAPPRSGPSSSTGRRAARLSCDRRASTTASGPRNDRCHRRRFRPPQIGGGSPRFCRQREPRAEDANGRDRAPCRDLARRERAGHIATIGPADPYEAFGSRASSMICSTCRESRARSLRLASRYSST